MAEKNYSFENLIVWQKAHQFVLEVYQMAENFPKTETYALTDQLKRASMSVPANIAEGFGRKGTKDKLRFYNISSSSLNEVRYFLILAHDLKYADTRKLQNDLTEVAKMLNKYISTISENLRRSS